LSFAVKLTREAEQDLLRLFEFVLERELERGGDLELAQRALDAVRDGFGVLARSPFSYRKAADSAFLRELVIPFGNSGYVALFEVIDSQTVVIGAVRQQREDDYH
jgi:plasmid stabilization system protein ParE